MQRIIILLLIITTFIGCNPNTDLNQIDDDIVDSNDIWWKVDNPIKSIDKNLYDSNFISLKVDFDSIKTIDNYFDKVHEITKYGQIVKPYITTKTGEIINLRKIRPRTGGGYSWDYRSVLNIYVGDGFCDVLYINSDSIKRVGVNNELFVEVVAFYNIASNIKNLDSLKNEMNQTDLEIIIKPRQDTLYNFNEIIETLERAFNKFKTNSKDSVTDLQISIFSGKR